MSNAYEHFFDIMEDLGFFEHIYESLPPDFTAVFEIARILEDANHPLTATLRPVLSLKAPGPRGKRDEDGPNLQVFIDDREEYEAGLIRTPQHLPRMYNHQWLLPEEVLYRRLAKKELWVPYAREPRYYPLLKAAVTAEVRARPPAAAAAAAAVVLVCAATIGAVAA